MMTSLSSLNSSNRVLSNATGAVVMYSASSNLGIGLTNPIYSLDVNGSCRTSSNMVCPGFSNVGGATYVSTLTCAGASAINGQLTASNGIYGSGFSNTAAGTTYTSVLCNVGSAYAPGFSNVAGATYVSALTCAGASSVGGQLTASNGLYGVGFSTASYTIVSTLSNSGTASFATATFGAAVTAPAGLYGSGFSNVGTAVYATTLSNSGDVLCGGNLTAGNVGMMRNRIINGDMRIDQRFEGGSLTVNTSNQLYAMDRMNLYMTNSDMSVAVQRVAPSNGLTGFQYACQLKPNAATGSLASGDMACLQHNLEGNNMSDLGWGTSAAVPVTVSFWVFCSVADTYAVGVQGAGNPGLTMVMPFTVMAANVWQRVAMSIPGPTTGTWATDNTLGATVRIVFAAGIGETIATTGTWQAASGSNVGVVGQSNLLVASTNVMQITGWQFERGSVATPFEYRPYAMELQLCQRYYEKSYEIGTVPGTATYPGCVHQRIQVSGSGYSWVFPPIQFKVPKRAIPLMGNLLVYDPQTGTVNNWHTDTNTSGVTGSYAMAATSPTQTNNDTSACGVNGFWTYINVWPYTQGQGVWFQWVCFSEL